MEVGVGKFIHSFIHRIIGSESWIYATMVVPLKFLNVGLYSGTDFVCLPMYGRYSIYL